MTMIRKERKVAALLAVKEDNHVKWYIFFTDKNGRFISLGVVDSGASFNGLLATLRLGKEEETRVRREVGALSAEFKVRGGDGQGQIIGGAEARLLMPKFFKRLKELAKFGTEEEHYLPGQKLCLACPGFAAVIYDSYFPPKDMRFADKLRLGFQPFFLPATG